MPTNYLTTDTDLTSVANKIRSKSGSSSQLSFPSGFNTEIEKLTNTAIASNAATANDILSGKKAYVNKNLLTGKAYANLQSTTQTFTKTVTSDYYGHADVEIPISAPSGYSLANSGVLETGFTGQSAIGTFSGTTYNQSTGKVSTHVSPGFAAETVTYIVYANVKFFKPIISTT